MNNHCRDKFYVVWKKGGFKKPKNAHPSIESAETEAQRLAELHPGTPFFVFESVSVRFVTKKKETVKQADGS